MSKLASLVIIAFLFIAAAAARQSSGSQSSASTSQHPITEGASGQYPSISDDSAVLPDGPYFGRTPPGLTPEVFAPGLMSLPDRRETKIVFSPDGSEVILGARKRLFYAKQENGHWSRLRVADFLNTETAVADVEPFFAPDGQNLFFVRNGHIWAAARANGSWAKPLPLLAPINSNSEEWHPTVSREGTLYFSSARENPPGGYSIYCARLENGHYAAAEKLDPIINSQFGAWDPFIAPDESYLIFSSEQPDGHGRHDQYISHVQNGKWTTPRNLGPAINTSATEYGSYISPDAKFYFFSRPSGWGVNDAADLYWVDSRAVLGAEK